MLHVDLILLVVKDKWWDEVLDLEDWQRDSNFVAAGSKEGCCLTPWCFVDALAEIRRECSRAFI